MENKMMVQQNQYSLADMEKMSQAIAKSGLFGMKTTEQAMALMIIAQAEGRHPGRVATDYHIIQGRPSLKADTMLARFQEAGGAVQWLKYADDEVSAIFTHPSAGKLAMSWTIQQAKNAGLTGKDVWKQYPRAMLRARVISEAVRTLLPTVLNGMYCPEEIQDFDAKPIEASYEPTPEVKQTIETKVEKIIEKTEEARETIKPKHASPVMKQRIEDIKKIHSISAKIGMTPEAMKKRIGEIIKRQFKESSELQDAELPQIIAEFEAELAFIEAQKKEAAAGENNEQTRTTSANSSGDF